MWIGTVTIVFIFLVALSARLAWLARQAEDPDRPNRWCRKCRDWRTHKRYIVREGAPFSGLRHEWGYYCLYCWIEPTRGGELKGSGDDEGESE